MGRESIESFFQREKEKKPSRETRTEKRESVNKSEITHKKDKLIVRFFSGIVNMSIFMIFFGLPLFFTNLTFQGVAFEKQMYFYFWVLLGLVAWVSRGLVSESIKIRKTPLDVPILIFWLVCILSTLFSVDRWHSFWGFFGDPSRGLMSITAIILFYYLLMSNFSQKLLQWLVGALVVSGSLLSIWTAMVVLKAPFLKSGALSAIPTNLFGSVISLGIFFCFLIPLLITVIFKIQDREKINKFLKHFSTLLLSAVLVTDLFLLWTLYSVDIPWVGVFAGIIIFLIFILSKIICPVTKLSWLPMVVFVALLVIPLVVPVDAIRLEIPISSSWEITKASVMDNFLLGSGPATFGYDFSLHQPTEYNLSGLFGQRFYQGTGLLFDALPMIGILGALPLIVIILSFLSLGGYLLVKDKEKNKIYSLGIMIAVLVLILDALYMRSEGQVLILGALVGTLALATILFESGSEEKYVSLAIKASAQYALTLAFMFMVVTAGVIFLFIFIGKAYVADVYAAQGAKGHSLEKFAKAINLFQKEGRYYTRLGQEYATLVNQEVLKGAEARNIGLIQDYLNKSIESSKKGSEMMKNDVYATEALGQIYENTGLITKNYALAEEAYRRALELEPNNPNFYVKLGQIKINLAVAKKQAQGAGNGKSEEADQLIREAEDLFRLSIEKKKNFSAGYYNLALAEEALGEIDSAIDDMQKAVYMERNVNNVFALGRLHQSRGKGNDNELAEAYFNEILGVNDKEVNTHFSLGILFEKTGRKDKAIKEYEKVLELLPSNVQEETKEQVRKMISNIRNGAENIPENPTTSVENLTPGESLPQSEETSQNITEEALTGGLSEEETVMPEPATNE